MRSFWISNLKRTNESILLKHITQNALMSALLCQFSRISIITSGHTIAYSRFDSLIKSKQKSLDVWAINRSNPRKKNNTHTRFCCINGILKLWLEHYIGK